MIAELGQFALLFALAAALIMAWTGFEGGHRNAAGLIKVAERSTMAHAGLTLAAFAALTWAHVTSDFSVLNVTENSHTAKPLIYKFTGVWGNHEGSMLLWLLVLAGYAAAVAAFAKGPSAAFRARVLGTLGLVAVAFGSFVAFTSNPFARLSPAPADGMDLNPLLQDPGLAIHPPFTYLGYVGFSVAFAFAVAALLEPRSDKIGERAWAGWARPWALTAWTFMTIGIALGAWWSFAELGWGGFWAWDPVENVSLMPWLAGAALIHTLKAVQARGAFKTWAFLLAILAFSMSLVGTFLVRSGLLTSVHAFAVDPERGIFILSILAVAVGGSLTLFAIRSPQGSPVGFELASRETGILVNNLLLMVVLGVVFLGTFYPVFNDFVSEEAVSIGPPYYNLVATPFILALIFLAAIGQRLPWRRGDLGATLRPMIPLAGGAVVIAATLYAVHSPRDVYAMFAIGLAVWLAGGVLLDLVERLEPLDRGGADWGERFARIPLRVWAMNVAHFGIALVALGTAGTGALRYERIAFMTPGTTVELPGDRHLTLVSVEETPGPNYASEFALFEARHGTGAPERLVAERRFYPVRSVETAEAGIVGGLAGDVYVTVGLRMDDRGWPVSASFFPFTLWLWVGSAIVALGGVLGLLDHAHASRRVPAAAPAAQPAPAPDAPHPAPAE
jgi:cytochrome c-type biogenesis protein CcmF